MRQKRRTYSIVRINKLEEHPTVTMGCVREFKVKAPNRKMAEERADALNAAWIAQESGPIPVQIYDFTMNHVRTGIVRTYSIMAQTMELAQQAASQLHEDWKEDNGI